MRTHSSIFCLLNRFLIVSAIALHALPLLAQREARFRAETKGDSVAVFDQGKHVTTYHFRSGSRPILWPLIGPDDRKFSRDYPMIKDSPNEDHDHPHHRSLWMNFGEINEFDLWAEGKGKGTVCHVDQPVITATADSLEIRAKHLWKAGKADRSSVAEAIASGCDEETATLAECDAVYVIDCHYQLRPVRDLHFGDTKEGMFAIRVPEAMRADKQGGRILTSEGRTNADAWGFPARWVDYSGKVAKDDSQEYGIAILVHPSSYNAAGRWHVRTYGLFAHNPIGVKDFPKIADATDRPGGHHFKSGELVRFSYRVVLHRQSLSREQGDMEWSDWSQTKPRFGEAK
jgi:hypothetical protein